MSSEAEGRLYELGIAGGTSISATEQMLRACPQPRLLRCSVARAIEGVQLLLQAVDTTKRTLMVIIAVTCHSDLSKGGCRCVCYRCPNGLSQGTCCRGRWRAGLDLHSPEHPVSSLSFLSQLGIGKLQHEQQSKTRDAWSLHSHALAHQSA